METFLLTAQIVIAILLAAVILLQQRGTALGGAFGGEGGSFHGTRRGIEKKLYWASIIFGALFIIFALLNLIF